MTTKTLTYLKKKDPSATNLNLESARRQRSSVSSSDRLPQHLDSRVGCGRDETSTASVTKMNLLGTNQSPSHGTQHAQRSCCLSSRIGPGEEMLWPGCSRKCRQTLHFHERGGRSLIIGVPMDALHHAVGLCLVSGYDLTHGRGLFDCERFFPDASGVGTREAMSVSSPFSLGMTLPAAKRHPQTMENLF